MSTDSSLLSSIPPSESDLLLREWGFDLIKEYYSIITRVKSHSPFVVELATGTGRMCAVLARMFASVVTGDISLSDRTKAEHRITQEYIQRVQFLQLDMESLPFPSQSLPFVVCMNTLHEVQSPAMCLTEMIRAVSIDGFLLVGDFNRKGFDAMQKIHQAVYQNNHSEGSISIDEIERKITASFSTVERIETPLNITLLASKKIHIGRTD